ncbi:Flavodoxin 1 [Hyella patelloides LEGE 07179]|uniref:Flavodoxin n=1 Tax=Hyella patelloides LEGE 07179 TaxID=945734 RepID=A0A563VR46_9CYAN|nr:flavodoxin [Hyella patelloides]VEP13860.1 Flavodoxin 1 [Hyella patelloides LEGE 07179]
MGKIGIFYGSTAGVTGEIAEKLVEHFDEDVCDLYNMEEDFDDFDDMLQYDYLLLGSSTWGSGEVQNDWRDPLVELEDEKPDFTGKKIAFFGAGDCNCHGGNFVSALGILYDYFKEAGATIVGDVPTDGYTFKSSFAVRDGKFVGLPIDEVNESEKTEERIESWIENLRQYFPQ